MNVKSVPPLLAASSLFLAAVCSSSAEQYGPQNFNLPDGDPDLGDDTTVASSDGTASIQDGALRLTQEGTPDTRASFRIPALAASAQGWTATFEFVLSDDPGSDPPADGFSFSYGAIPEYNPDQGDPAASDAHGNAEEGWHPGVDHLAFEFDTWMNFDAEQGFNISMNGTDLAFENQPILDDGQMIPGFAALSWHPVNGASMSVDLGFGLTPVFTNIPTPGFAGDDDYRFAFSARTGGATQTLKLDNVQVTTIPPGFIVLPGPVISEFMADNETVGDHKIEDEDCRSSDWFEIFNATASPVNFDGWYLTDDSGEPTKWRMPALVLEPNEHRLIFASGKDQTEGELHTNFSLEKDGGYLALIRPNGTVASSYNYTQQVENISYGTLGPDQTLGSFSEATPGELNVGPQGEVVLEKPIFSLENQVFSRPTTLELSATSPTADIRYTTDNTAPTNRSPLYTDPIRISGTTRVTARLFEPGITNGGPVRDRTFVQLDRDLEDFTSDLPIIIVDSFGRNIDGEGSANSGSPRRPVHTIFLDRDPQTGRTSVLDVPNFEGRGGMRVRGQTSSGFPKKQYALETWDSEGNDKDVSIFGMPSDSDWVIHAPYSDKTLMRNKMVYDMSRELGYPAVRTKFCELFFNANGGNVSMADYRGVYVFMERIKRGEDRVNIKKLEDCDNAEPAVTGGYIWKKDKGAGSDVTVNTVREFHTMAFVEPDDPSPRQKQWLDRHLDLFETTLHSNARFADPESGYPKFIDVRSFIDVHIWVEVFKQIDGYRLSSHFYKDRGKKIVSGPVWDYNLSLGNANYLEGQNWSGWYYTLVSAQQYPYYGRLFRDPEFVIQYWDRYFELRERILETNSLLDRIDRYTDEIREGAERNFSLTSHSRNLLGTYTWPNADGYQNRRTHQAEVDWMKNWLRQRVRWMDTQHARPPEYDLAAGPIESGAVLTISNPNSGAGTIYYTTDGTDPRLPGNASSTVLLPEESECAFIVPTEAIADWNSVDGPANLESWSTGSAALGYESEPGLFADLINTTVPEGTTSLYTRFTFEIATQDALDALDGLTLNMKFDDGYVAYLNGEKVAGPNAPTDPEWNSVATSAHENAAAIEFESVNITGALDQLQVGQNVLAIQFLNTGVTSKEFLGSPELVARISGAAPSPSAQIYDDPLVLESSQTIKARVLSPSDWSPVQTEIYLIDGQPAGPSNLAVTEVNYRPAPPAADQEQLGFDVRTDLEYIEIMNIGPVHIDLSGVRFTTGVQFNFDLGEVHSLAPGERAVVVSNRPAFESRYAALLSRVRIAGEFTNNLSNGGETIILTDANGDEIRNFTYDDRDPWPESADGTGMSLVLIAPRSNPDHNDPLNWRASITANGVPGGSDDGSTFAGDPDGDDDGNGIRNFLQYSLAPTGVAPTLPATAVSSFLIGEESADFLTITYTRNRIADDVAFTVEISQDLLNWTSDPQDLLLLSRVENGDGTETITLRLASPIDAAELFARLRVDSRIP